jgi:hypothetical protein
MAAVERRALEARLCHLQPGRRLPFCRRRPNFSSRQQRLLLTSSMRCGRSSSQILHSARILADGCEKLRMFSVEGTKLNEPKISEYLERSLMLVTALSPKIGYDKASQIAHIALQEGTTLKQAALKSGFVDEGTFDRVVDPTKMVSNA